MDDQVAARRVAEVLLQSLEVDVLAIGDIDNAQQVCLAAAPIELDLDTVARHPRAHGHVQRPQRRVLSQQRPLP